jgi:hypothetical protein
MPQITSEICLGRISSVAYAGLSLTTGTEGPWLSLPLENGFTWSNSHQIGLSVALVLCNTCSWFKSLLRCIWLSGHVSWPSVLASKEAWNSPNVGSGFSCAEKSRRVDTITLKVCSSLCSLSHSLTTTTQSLSKGFVRIDFPVTCHHQHTKHSQTWLNPNTWNTKAQTETP